MCRGGSGLVLINSHLRSRTHREHTNRLPIQRICTRDRLPVENPLLGHSPAADSHDAEVDDCHAFVVGRLGDGELGIS
jgi:hypothetical protein